METVPWIPGSELHCSTLSYRIATQSYKPLWRTHNRPKYTLCFFIFRRLPLGCNTGLNAIDRGSDPEFISPAWLAKSIRQGHGALCAVYPDIACGTEGYALLLGPHPQ